MTARFQVFLAAAQQRNRSTLAIGLAPALSELPLALTRYDEPFLPYGKAVIDATRDLVCGYVFHLGRYLSLGAAGAIALERTLAYTPAHLVRILHGPFASPDYARAAFEEAFNAHAVTLAPTTNAEEIIPYLQREQYGVFIKLLSDSDELPLAMLSQQYTGQLGVYRHIGPGHKRCTLLSAPHLEIEWYWGEHIFTSRGEDCAAAWHAAAAALRQPPGSGER